MLNVEIKTVPWNKNYEVGSNGAVYKKKEEVLQIRDNCFRKAVKISGKIWPIDILVLTVFVGHAPDETNVIHKDGNVNNNYLENLEWAEHVKEELNISEFPVYVSGEKGKIVSWAPQYEVDSNGIVYKNGKDIGWSFGCGSYRGVSINGKHWKTHVLVLTVFVGPKPEGMIACHKNDNRNDNRLENLYWGTPKQNMEDASKNKKTGDNADTLVKIIKRYGKYALSDPFNIPVLKGKRKAHFDPEDRFPQDNVIKKTVLWDTQYEVDSNGVIYKDGQNVGFASDKNLKRTVLIGYKRWLVSDLVLTVFVGPRLDGMKSIHKNKDKSDNRLENLYWGTIQVRKMP